MFFCRQPNITTTPLGKLLIQIKIEHPELYISTEYHFDDLRNITGELTIIGMSPNNDRHIFDIINNNPGIEKIQYYFFSESEKKSALSLFRSHRCECLSVIDLWKKLKCSKKTYQCNYPDLPKAIPQLGKGISLLSDDIISNEKLIEEANRIPQFQIDRLTAVVDAKMKEFSLDNHDENEVDRQRRTISFVALQEGILPAVLYTLYVMNTKNRNRPANN